MSIGISPPLSNSAFKGSHGAQHYNWAVRSHRGLGKDYLRSQQPLWHLRGIWERKKKGIKEDQRIVCVFTLPWHIHQYLINPGMGIPQVTSSEYSFSMRASLWLYSIQCVLMRSPVGKSRFGFCKPYHVQVKAKPCNSCLGLYKYTCTACSKSIFWTWELVLIGLWPGPQTPFLSKSYLPVHINPSCSSVFSIQVKTPGSVQCDE